MPGAIHSSLWSDGYEQGCGCGFVPAKDCKGGEGKWLEGDEGGLSALVVPHVRAPFAPPG